MNARPLVYQLPAPYTKVHRRGAKPHMLIVAYTENRHLALQCREGFRPFGPPPLSDPEKLLHRFSVHLPEEERINMYVRVISGLLPTGHRKRGKLVQKMKN